MKQSLRWLPLVALCLCSSASAQTPQFVGSVVQPEVWHFAEPVASQVSSGGDLSLAIPVLSVPGPVRSFDVVFSYRAGISPGQSASWIGLGWNFDPGSITREVQGGARIPCPNSPPCPSSIVDVDYTSYPTILHDLYYVHMPNGTKRMARRPSGLPAVSNPQMPAVTNPSGFYTEEWTNWKIDVTEGVVAVDGIKTGPSGGADIADFSRFVITDESGTRYVYEEPTLSRWWDPGSASKTYVSTWRLRSILGLTYSGALIPTDGAIGDYVRFDYGHLQSAIPMNTERGLTQVEYLTKIVTPTHYALFNTAPRVDLDQVGTDYEYRGPDGRRTGIKATNIYRNLGSIELRTKAGDLVQTVTLTQDDRLAETQVPRDGHPCSQLNDDWERRSQDFCKGKTTLLAIGFKGQNGEPSPGYTFSYSDKLGNPSDPMYHFSPGLYPNYEPFFSWLHVDDFGYYNYFKHTPFQTPPLQSEAKIDVDIDDAEVWSLVKIQNPLGGTERIFYSNDYIEPVLAANSYKISRYWDESGPRQAGYNVPDESRNDQQYYSGTGVSYQGGTRVERIEREDGLGAVYTTAYTYGPGRITGLPGSWITKCTFEAACGDIITLPREAGVIVRAPAVRGAGRVEYEWVRESVTGQGSTTTHYSTANTHPDVRQIRTVLYVGNHGGQGFHVTTLSGNEDWAWGHALETVARDEAGTVIQSSSNDISFAKRDVATVWNYTFPANKIIDQAIVQQGHVRLNKTTDTYYGTFDSTPPVPAPPPPAPPTQGQFTLYSFGTGINPSRTFTLGPAGTESVKWRCTVEEDYGSGNSKRCTIKRSDTQQIVVDVFATTSGQFQGVAGVTYTATATATPLKTGNRVQVSMGVGYGGLSAPPSTGAGPAAAAGSTAETDQ